MCLNAGERAAKKSMNLKLTLNERKEEQQTNVVVVPFFFHSVSTSRCYSFLVSFKWQQVHLAGRVVCFIDIKY